MDAADWQITQLFNVPRSCRMSGDGGITGQGLDIQNKAVAWFHCVRIRTVRGGMETTRFAKNKGRTRIGRVATRAATSGAWQTFLLWDRYVDPQSHVGAFGCCALWLADQTIQLIRTTTRPPAF